jgi:ABC-2 type transport system permease protein
LISGVYYPINVLPSPLKEMATFSPATYVLDGTRQALLEGVSTVDLWMYIWPVLIMGALLIPLGLWIFRQAELYAKRAGKLHRNG